MAFGSRVVVVAEDLLVGKLLGSAEAFASRIQRVGGGQTVLALHGQARRAREAPEPWLPPISARGESRR